MVFGAELAAIASQPATEHLWIAPTQRAQKLIKDYFEGEVHKAPTWHCASVDAFSSPRDRTALNSASFAVLWYSTNPHNGHTHTAQNQNE